MKSGKNSKILDIGKYNFDFQKMGGKGVPQTINQYVCVNPGPYF